MWEEIGPAIKARREDTGLTQHQLAQKVGVERVTIARIEIGNRRPSLELLDAIAWVLGCRVADLLPEERPSRPSARRRRR